MTTMHHDGSNALTVQFAFAFLWFYSVLPCHLPSVRFFFYQRLQLCAHLMMSENHKRRQLGDTKKKEQRWLDGNGKGKKKKNWIVIRDQSYLFTTHWTRQCALTMNRGRQSQWLCFLKLFEITTGCCNNIFEGMKSRIKLNDALWRVWILFWPFFFSFVFCFVFREGREEKKIVKWGRLSFVWLFLRKWNQDVLVDIIWRGGLLSSKTPSFLPPPHIRFFFQFFFSCHWLLFIQMTTVRRGGRQEAVVIISTLFCRSKWVLSDFFFRFSISFWCPDVWSLFGDVIVKYRATFHNHTSFFLSFLLLICLFLIFVAYAVCVVMDLGLAGWLDLIRSCAVSSTSSCRSISYSLVDFQPTRL